MISWVNIRERPSFITPTANPEFLNNSLFFPTVRQCLYFYFKKSSYKHVLLPDFVPQGIYDPFLRLGFTISFYHVDLDLSINPDEVVRHFERNNAPDVFVYIHHFGVYYQNCLQSIKKVVPKSVLFIEDAAHTLPHDFNLYSGDIVLFSLQKLCGIDYGGIAWMKNKHYERTIPLEPFAQTDKILRKKLGAHVTLETFLTNNHIPIKIQRTLRIPFKYITNYYPFLCNHYPDCLGQLSKQEIENIARIDFNKMYIRRKEIAVRYTEGVQKRFLLAIPTETLFIQSLLGFPVIVDHQNNFNNYLINKQIRGFALNTSWWFSKDPRSDLHNSHFLLPISHYLTNKQIDRIINVVNDYNQG